MSMFRQAQHDRRCCGLICEFADSRIPKPWFVNTQTGYRYQTTCSTHTPANKAALKALAIAEGGTTVVPKIFSGEVMEECIVSTASMSSLRSVWALLRSKVQKMVRPRGEIKRSLRRSFHQPDIQKQPRVHTLGYLKVAPTEL